ncbi:MAG: 2-oxoacid:ferredoxin oxidoreductase subunit gamma [Candidatus Lokiarchaeota archaeon]|nr:2-oxoacid:ferredoxin oxidoreductase subunit gamma [Candidatus Lokiarchaeota archaeon]
MTRTELKLAGYGGQGVITLSKLIAEGVMLYENKEVAQTEAYGAAARGGSCWAEVVISDDEIDYPRAVEPDIMVLLSKEAANAFKKDVKKDGVFIVDPTTVSRFKARNNVVYQIPATDIAINELKMPVVGNVIFLGAIALLTGIMSKDAARKTVEKSVPQKALDINLKALEKGFELAEKAKKEAEASSK